jgi:hypothetical protein
MAQDSRQDADVTKATSDGSASGEEDPKGSERPRAGMKASATKSGVTQEKGLTRAVAPGAEARDLSPAATGILI